MFNCECGCKLFLVKESDLNPIKPDTGNIKLGLGNRYFTICRNCGILKNLPMNWQIDECELQISIVS